MEEMPICLAGTSKQIIAKREMDYNVILCYGCGNSLYVARRLDGDKGLWDSGGCMMYMACIHVCPMAAIRMRIPEKNPKARYRNKNISICGIVDADNQWREEEATVWNS